MPSFMDYYQDELRKRSLGGSTGAPASSGVSLSSLRAEPGSPDEKDEGGPQSFGNWLIDIISRPLYGVTNTINKSVESAVSAQEKADDGDASGSFGDAVGTALGIPGRFLEGLVSTDSSVKKSFGQTLESVTDRIGEANDPHYKNRADNVDPFVKGTLGFAGDVALDPTTYIPAAWLLKGAKAGVGAADKGLSALSEGLVGADRVAGASTSASRAAASARAAEETANVASGAVKGKGRKPQGEPEDGNPFEDIYNLDPGDFRPSGAGARGDSGKVERLETFGSDLARVEDIFRGAPAARRAELPSPQAALPERAGEAPDMPFDTSPGPVKNEADFSQMPRVPDEVLDESGAIPTGGGSIADLIMQSPNRQPLEEVLTRLADDAATGRTRPFDSREFISTTKERVGLSLPGDAVSKNYTIRELANIATLNKGTARGSAATKAVVEAISREKLAREGAAATPMDALGAFQQAARMEPTELRAAFGDDLYDFLGTVNSPKKMHDTLTSIKTVIEPDADVMDTLRNMDQNLSRLLSQRLGIPRSSKPKTPEEAAELADRMLNNNEPYQAAMAKGLADALDAELVDLKSKGYLHYIQKLGMKVARSSKKAGEGKGRYVDQLNGFSQYTMLRKQSDAIELAALDLMRARGMKGNSFTDLYSAQRTEVYREAVLRVMDDQAKLLDDIGAHMSIGVGLDTTMLSMSEVYRGLISAADELGMARTIDQGLFNYGTQAAPTAVTDAVSVALAGGSRDDILAVLTDAKKYGNKGLLKNSQGRRPNNLIDSGHGWGSLNRNSLADIARELGVDNQTVKAMIRKKERGRTSKTTGTTRKADHFYLSYKVGDRNLMAEALADTILRSADDLKIRAAENEAAFVARTRQEIHTLSSDELSKIESFLKDPSGAILKIRAFAARKKRIEAGAAAMNASADAARGAEETVDAALGEELVSTMVAAERGQAKAGSASTAVELREATDAFTGGTWKSVKDEWDERPGAADVEDPLTGLRSNEEWADIVDETTPPAGDWTDMLFDEAAEFIQKKAKKTSKKKRKGPFVDLTEDAPAMVDAFGQRIIDPYGIMKHKVRLWFDQNYLAPNAMRTAHAWQNSMSMRTAYVGHQLNAISKAARKISDDPNLLQNVFASIQRGESFGSDEAVKGLDDMVRGVLGDFFDLDASGSMGNVFLRTTSQPELINAMLKQKGIDQAFDLGLARKVAKEQGTPLDQALASQWKGWTVTDPLDFMHRMSLARQELAFNKGAALSFVDMARSKGAVSNKKAPGYVRIQASGDSRFAAHLPQDIFVKKELAEELRRVEQVFRTSREFQGQLGDFVRNVYAPLLNSWKFAITLPRPGHHIRNLIGDTSVTWMRRGNMHFARSWKDAVKLLSTRANYADVNMLEAATRYGTGSLPKGGEKLISSGKFDFTADELYAALAEGGALPTYQIGEDFVNASGALDKVLGKVTLRDTMVGEQLGKLSEGRDHLARFQHFIQALRQDAPKWKGSREDLIQNAVREVIKYHPDASLLTTMESKLRLAIPFYSWFGKIIPALVESLIMHPGRLSVFNKASFNLAVANGLDPESLSDPFPEDQLFPSFITESTLGPQFLADALPLPGADGQYIRMNPGIAHLDVMDTLGSDPLRGIAGMTSPLVRVPAELLSGGSWSTGGRINDWSDYVDQSIPGVNYLANVSGFSPTGSVESLLSGQGLDPQAQVARGNKTDFDKYLSVANWISGLGLQNLSRPNYVNYAEIERRNEAEGK